MYSEHKNLKELTFKESEEILKRGSMAHLGCYSHGEVFVTPITYVYEGDYIYGHSLIGKKIKMMRSNPHVCLQIGEIYTLFNWKSVIVQGHYEELKEGIAPAQALRALKVKIAGLVQGLTPMQVEIDAILSRAIIYRIKIEKITGRCEQQSVE